MEDEYRIHPIEDAIGDSQQRIGDEGHVADDGDDPEWDHRFHEEGREDENGCDPSCYHKPHLDLTDSPGPERP